VSDAQIVDALGASWGIDVSSVAYAPVGFGSHHWRAEDGSSDWFVTVDDLVAKRRHETETIATARARLIAALETARDLAASGLEFVVAPTSTLSGHVAKELTPRYLAAVYPHVSGDTFDYGPYQTTRERIAIVDLLVRLHETPKNSFPSVMVDDLGISSRDGLDSALCDLSVRWTSGPFAESSRQLLRVHVDPLIDALGQYDNMAAAALSQPERFVITHGEPHRANTIATDQGLMLIDWDTTLLAPPERDLWELNGEDSSVAGTYTEQTGTTIVDEFMDLYQLSWDLNEVAIYLTQFRQDHIESDDTTEAWTNLRHFLDSSRWQKS